MSGTIDIFDDDLTKERNLTLQSELDTDQGTENEKRMTPVTPTNASSLRDEKGLIKTVQYPMLPDGRVDWRKLLKPEHLVPNKQKTQETDITKIKDEHLLILLEGIKYLARLRGFKSIDYVPMGSLPNPDYICVKCQIQWIKNFEEDCEQTTSGIGDACPQSTNGFGSLFLGAIAENRAFVRCVRNYLGINICGKDEISTSDKKEDATQEPEKTPEPTQPIKPDQLVNVLIKRLKKFDPPLTFTQVKNSMIKKKTPGAEDWGSIEDIPRTVIIQIIEMVDKKLEESEKEKVK